MLQHAKLVLQLIIYIINQVAEVWSWQLRISLNLKMELLNSNFSFSHVIMWSEFEHPVR